MQSSKWIITPVAVAVAVLSACTHNMDTKQNHCYIMSDPPEPTVEAIANAQCPVGVGVVHLSAVFKDGKPVGVGGGTDASTGNKNDKRVQGGQKICWVATDTDGKASDQKFDILFSPSKNPTPNQNYQSVNIFPLAPSGLQYKYTVWVNSGECGFLDPRFFID